MSVSLRTYNTFGINVNARAMATYTSVDELQTILHSDWPRPLLQIGGGSNLLFLHDYDGTILFSNIHFVREVACANDLVHIEVGAGVVWDDFVQYCVQHNYGGAENLSLIPGQVGASAVQNIGAYGVEAKDLIETVHCVEMKTGAVCSFAQSDLQYGYRTSRFKTEWKNQYIVTSVVFRLSAKPLVHAEYKGLAAEMAKISTNTPNLTLLQTVRQAVINLRQSKLPDPAQWGNAGSYFMNPVVQAAQFAHLQAAYPDIPHYPLPNSTEKIPAAWLIEQTGWKGRSLGPAAVYDKQPLVLVNRGGATGTDVANLATAVQRAVFDKFAIQLATEVIYVE